jgi:hypothetical protein
MNRRGLQILVGFIAVLMLADFVFRGVVPALGRGKNNFSEVYVGAWLWRHGQNFYDAAVTTNRLTNAQVRIVLVYPPTALVLIAPFTFLPWDWENPIWLLLGLVAIGITIAPLIGLGGFRL